MDKPKHKGSLDGGNEDDFSLMLSVWATCLGIVLVLIYIMEKIK